MNEENQMLALALKYAGHDLPVFPLYGVNEKGVCDCGKVDCTGNSRGKHPITQNGYKDATTDKFQIKAWWKKHPNANIGIATGKDSIIVLDIDGEDGLKSLEALKQHGEIPDTVGVITGKGLHLYFKSDVPVKQSIGTIGTKLDVRSDGGYVVAPSSRHYSGVNYRYEEGKGLGEIEIAEIPDWLITIINSDKTKNPKNLPMMFNNIIPEHYRNDTLFKYASYLRGKGYGYEEILKSLTNENETKCKPPLELSDLKTIAKSVLKYTPEAMKTKRPPTESRWV